MSIAVPARLFMRMPFLMSVPFMSMSLFMPVPLFVLIRLFMPVLFFMSMFISMYMLFPQSAATDRQAHQVRDLLQCQQARVRCQFAQRPVEKRFQARPDPHHQVGRRQHLGVGRPQRVGVRRLAGAQQQPRFGDAGHHAGQQGVHRPDGRHRVRHRPGVRGRAGESRRQRQRAAAKSSRRGGFFRGWHK